MFIFKPYVFSSYSDVNLVKDLSSASNEYDALVLVATQLDEIEQFVNSSVFKHLQSFRQVRIFLFEKLRSSR